MDYLILAALLVTITLLSLSFRYFSQGHEPISFAWGVILVSSVLSLPFFFVMRAWEYVPSLWPFLLLAAFAWLLQHTLAMYSYKYATVSLREPLSTISVVLVLLAGVILFKEAVSIARVAGVVCIIIGIILASLVSRRFRWEKGSSYVFFTALSMAACVLIDKTLVGKMSPFAYLFFTFGPAFVLLSLWKIRSLPAFFKDTFTHPLGHFICGLLNVVMFTLVFLGFSRMDATVVFPVLRAGSVIAIIVATFIFADERSHRGQKIAAGVLVAIGGILVTSF